MMMKGVVVTCFYLSIGVETIEEMGILDDAAHCFACPILLIIHSVIHVRRYYLPPFMHIPLKSFPSINLTRMNPLTDEA